LLPSDSIFAVSVDKNDTWDVESITDGVAPGGEVILRVDGSTFTLPDDESM